MNIRGFHYDLARGQRGDLDFLEKLIRRLKKYDYNMLVFNIEYRFRFPSHSAIGPEGSLDPAGTKYLDGIAKKLGIHLVPEVNCLSHNEGIGFLERYKHLRVAPTALDKTAELLIPGRPDVIRLLADLYSDLAKCFSAPFFHIGGDEVRCMHLNMPDATEEERFDKVFRHFLAIFRICARLGKTPIMWGDMLLKHKHQAKYIPRDVIICDWDYEATSRRRSILHFKRSGRRVLVAPGISTCRALPVLAERSTKNICGVVREARELGAEGVLLCNWENDRGATFLPAWPWVFLCSEIAAGNDKAEKYFLRKYASDEFGLTENLLDQWHRISDKIFWTPVFPQNHRHPLIGVFRTNLIRTPNALQFMWEARAWFNKNTRRKIRPLVPRLKSLAKEIHAKARRNRMETKRLVQVAGLYESWLDMFDLLENAAENYNLAVRRQYDDPKRCAQLIRKTADDLGRLARRFQVMIRWVNELIRTENHAADDNWFLIQAEADIKKRIAVLRNSGHSKNGRLTFERLLSDIPGTPNRVIWR